MRKLHLDGKLRRVRRLRRLIVQQPLDLRGWAIGVRGVVNVDTLRVIEGNLLGYSGLIGGLGTVFAGEGIDDGTLATVGHADDECTGIAQTLLFFGFKNLLNFAFDAIQICSCFGRNR